jgi:PAS domain S-box-containing protein
MSTIQQHIYYEHLEAAVDSAGAALFTFNPRENRLHYFNQSMLDLTGWSGFELAKKQASSLFPGQIAELTGFTLESLSKGRAWSNAFSLACASGETLSVELFASRFQHGPEEFLLFTAYDRRTAERARLEAEVDAFYKSGMPQGNRYEDVFRKLERGSQLILEAAGEGIYGVDAKGNTTFLNRAGEKMLGWRSEELIGRNAHAYMHHSHEDGREYTNRACPIYAAFRDGAVHRVSDEVFWRKDGTCFPVEYTSTPIEEKGRLLGAVVVFRDVTEQRQAKSELVKALNEVDALRRRLEQENAYLQDELRKDADHNEIVGKSAAIKNILRQIELVASSDATVLVTGESGTGKELIARAIHASSSRSHRPLIRVNCASIPRDLFESEFFGHRKGAFTGAIGDRVGRFELADGGTLFLDEVGELPLEHQAKLLRVLQEMQFERVGDTRTLKVDVRVIAATNRDLRREVQEKRFREDLFFRLNVYPIDSPPLRERLDDIAELAMVFLRRACERANKPMLSISLADVERMKGYDWPGNIRELENVIERAVITSIDGRMRLHVPKTLEFQAEQEQQRDQDFLPNALRSNSLPSNSLPSDGLHSNALSLDVLADDASGPSIDTIDSRSILTETQRKSREMQNIESALRQCRGKISGPGGAARMLDVKPTTLYSRIHRYGIDPRKFK